MSPPDADHWFDQDLTTGATGDILLADGIHLSDQRIVRRLMTALKGYLWHPAYGAGVPERIGNALDLPLLTSVIRSQIFLEASVARVPEPVIVVSPIQGGVNCPIAYVDALTGQQASLQFDASA